jgi:hypothetical protein
MPELRTTIVLYVSAIALFACGNVAGIAEPDALDTGGSSPLPWHTFEASGPVHYSASVSWHETDDEPIQVLLSIHNPADTEVLISTGVCGFGLRAYAILAPSGPSVWDDRPPTLGPNQGWGCPDVGLEFRVAPGETQLIPVHQYGLRTFASLPSPGRYVFVVVLKDREGVVHLVPTNAVEIS